MKPRKNTDRPSDEAIVAWLEGEMTAEEAEAFEQRVWADAGLEARVQQTRQALEAARAWCAEEPPGAERVDALPIPPVAAPAPVAAVIELPRRRGISSRMAALAAAALFIFGFLAGQFAPRPGVLKDFEENKIPQTALHAPQPSGIGKADEDVRAPRIPQSAIRNPQSSPPPPPPSAPPTTREEDGRVIIETTLVGSGGQALWVVDGEFQVAQNHDVKKGSVQ